MRPLLRNWFLNRPLNQKLILIFFIPVIFLVTVSAMTMVAFEEFESAEDLLDRSNQIRAQATYYLELLYSVQNAFRGFVLTGDRTFLSRYDEAKGDMDVAGLELSRLVRDSPLQSQRDRVVSIQMMTRRLVEEKDGVIARIASGIPEDGTTYIKSRHGQQLVDMIASLLSLFESAASQIQNERRAVVETTRGLVLRVIVGGSMLVLLLTGLGLVIVTRSVTRPMSSLASAATQIGAAEPATFPDADRLDEVGVLSRSMAQMDRQIRAQIGDLKLSESMLRALSLNLALSELRYRSLVEHVPLGIYTSTHLTWTFANPFERELIGLPEDVEPTFEHWRNALHADDRERVVREFGSCVERQCPFEAEFRFLRPDGSIRHVLSRGIPVRDSPSEGAFYLCLDLDVTHMVELQQRLAPAERLATLTRMATSIAHDLRTPLLGIEQGLQGFKYMAASRLEPAARQLLEDLHTGARLAVGVVQDILDLYRQAYGELPLSYSHFTLHEVSREVVELMAAELRDRRLSITIEGDAPPVWADRRRLVRVMVNLLDNAVKNSPAGGRVRVTIEGAAIENGSPAGTGKDGGSEPREGPRLGAAGVGGCKRIAEVDGCKRIVVAVEDEGQGLDPKALDILFEPSRPVSMPTRGGTGLGLYLCRLVITAHKGILTAQNRPEGGARFIFDMPVDGREVSDAHPTPDRRRPAIVQAQSADGP